MWPAPPPAERPSMERVKRFRGTLDDDMDARSLKRAADESLAYLAKLDPGAVMDFGGRKVSPAELAASLERLVEIYTREPDPAKRSKGIVAEFDVYRGTGEWEDGNVLITGYFQPLLNARRTRDNIFKWPLYRRPDDLVDVDLGLFASDLAGKRIAGRVENGRLVPYHDRRAIDRNGALGGRELEIIWVDDPVDAFILHVQGSGVAILDNGRRVFINYAASNGRRYRSIGRLLIDMGAIPKEEMSLPAIRRWLAEHPEHLERTLYYNPSYVFFRMMDDGPFGSTGAKLVPGRSAAFDPKMFPKGAVAHVAMSLPVVEEGEITGRRESGRFVFNHDQGGAIKGAGRMDLFFGLGRDAELSAGVMRHPGEVTFLILKPDVYKKRAAAR